MKNTRVGKLALPGALLLAASFVVGTTGCTSAKYGDKDGGTAAVSSAAPAAGGKTASAGAAQIWAENCNRCHNVRSPSQYSDAQWEVIGTHMRVRGYLTGEEQRTIIEFLKQGN